MVQKVFVKNITLSYGYMATHSIKAGLENQEAHQKEIVRNAASLSTALHHKEQDFVQENVLLECGEALSVVPNLLMEGGVKNEKDISLLLSEEKEYGNTDTLLSKLLEDHLRSMKLFIISMVSNTITELKTYISQILKNTLLDMVKRLWKAMTKALLMGLVALEHVNQNWLTNVRRLYK